MTAAASEARTGSRTRSGRAHGAAGELVAAIGFLTRLPVPVALRRSADRRTGAAAFGLVGAGLGLAGAIPLLAIGERLPVPAAIAALAVIAVLTGALHLDGMADTADALAAPSPAAAERARRDPRAGPAGVVAVVLVLGIDAALVATMAAGSASLAAAAVVIAAAGSRAAAPLTAILIGRRGTATDERSVADWFTGGVSLAVAVIAVAAAAAAAVLADLVVDGHRLISGLGIGLSMALAAALALRRLRGRLDGDGYGAIVELGFAATLAAIAVLVA